MENKPLSKNKKRLIVVGVIFAILYLVIEQISKPPDNVVTENNGVVQEGVVPGTPITEMSEAQSEPNLVGSLFTNIDETYSIDLSESWQISQYSYLDLQDSEGETYYNEYLVLEKDGAKVTISNFDGPSYYCSFSEPDDMLYPPNLGFYEEIEKIKIQFHDEVIVGKLINTDANEHGFCVYDDILGEDAYGSLIIGNSTVVATFPEDYTDELYNEVVDLVESVNDLRGN